MRTDLCSVTGNGQRIISYLSVCMGLMADLDINTEHLRWMGDTRFVYGFLRGSAFTYLVRVTTTSHPHFVSVIWQRPSPIKISLKVSERDKHKLIETYQSAYEQDWDGKTCWDDLHPSEKLPPLKHSETDTDGWEDFDVPVLYFSAGLMPYASRYVSFSMFIVDISLSSPHRLLGTYFSGQWHYRATA
jgi:sphingosine kinase